MSNIAEFYKNTKASKKENHLINNLTKPPRKENVYPSLSNNILSKNYFQEADLLYLPTDKFGYKYCLVVIDVYDKICDAEPLKTAEAIVKAFKKIYKRGILKIPKIIQFDQGTEFKEETKQYFKEENADVKYALANRHRQMALVERKNKEIGGTIMKYQNAQELIKQKTVKGWVSELPELIKVINEHIPKRKPIPNHILYNKFSMDILPLHEHVRTILDHPINAATGKRMGNIFRSGDIRWNQIDRTIEKIILNPGQPVMYQLNGNSKDGLDNKVAYTQEQLQVIKENEINIDPKIGNIKKNKSKLNK